MRRASRALIDKELDSLLAKETMELYPSVFVFVSTIFLVSKKTEDYRPVITLKSLNSFYSVPSLQDRGHASTQGFASSGRLVQQTRSQGCLPHGTDPSITPPLLSPVGVLASGQFTCLPFGISSAPWSFTKLLKMVLEFFHAHGVHSIVYLDDILLFNSDPSRLW